MIFVDLILCLLEALSNCYQTTLFGSTGRITSASKEVKRARVHIDGYLWVAEVVSTSFREIKPFYIELHPAHSLYTCFFSPPSSMPAHPTADPLSPAQTQLCNKPESTHAACSTLPNALPPSAEGGFFSW